MTTEERWLAFALGLVLVAALAVDDFTAEQRRVAGVAECQARGGIPLEAMDGRLACVDSATLVALPALYPTTEAGR